MIFVLQSGRDEIRQMEYSYSRRAQSVVCGLVWRDRAIVEADDFDDAVPACQEYIKTCAEAGFRARWRLEPRGLPPAEMHPIEITPSYSPP